jgi:hypothetical protein
VLLCLASPREEVLLEFVIELVEVLFVDLEGGKGELAAVDQCALELVVGQVIEGETSLLDALFHQVLNAGQVAQKTVFAFIGGKVPTLVEGFKREGTTIYSKLSMLIWLW